ncbi:MAG: SDR family oxidoreductase [Mesorhizobium sp.]|nr:MAG: SDR family oxidoreductase [Mesorhizobium sp.]
MEGFEQPREIAEPVVFLASKPARFINGVTFPIDSGYLTI